MYTLYYVMSYCIISCHTRIILLYYIVMFFGGDVDDPASLLVIEPVARCFCSGGEGTPPETLKCLTPNPRS